MQRLFRRETKHPDYIHDYSSMNGFRASIVLNPRDAMVFGKLIKLSEDVNDQVMEEELKAFKKLLTNQYGGKVIMILPPALLAGLSTERAKSLQDIVNRVFAPGPGILKLTTREAADEAYHLNIEKPYVKAHLAKFLSGELRVLSQKEISERTVELSEFKNTSGLVNEQKVKAGLYNEQAEQHKCANPFVRHVVIVNQANEFIACGMWTMCDDVAYGGDYALRSDYKSQSADHHSGMSRVLGIKMYENVISYNPHFRCIIFIGGVTGNLEHISKSLYGEEGFKSVSLELKHDTSAQVTHGIILNFSGPGPKLMSLMNRDATITSPDEISTKDDPALVQKAMEQVKRTPLRVYAATIPGPQPIVQEVIGISSFLPPQLGKGSDEVVPEPICSKKH